MQFRSLVLALLLATAAAQEDHIPAFRGTAFSGDVIVLPDALHGRSGVLVIGFSTNSREPVTAWAKLLAADYRSSTWVYYLEMPVLASVPRLFRGYVASKIKEAVPGPAQSRCVIIDSEETGWKRTAHFAKPDDAYVLVVDQTGLVRWRISGPPTTQSYATLKHYLDPPPPTP